MKKLFFGLLISLMSIISLNAQQNKGLVWEKNFEQAKVKANREGKSILLFFTGSDWCGLCKMLNKDFFNTEEFKKIARKNLILYKADFPRRTDIVTPKQKKVNEALDKKYSKTRASRVFPTVFLLDANGKQIDFLESYNYIHDTTRHFKLLEYAIKK